MDGVEGRGRWWQRPDHEAVCAAWTPPPVKPARHAARIPARGVAAVRVVKEEERHVDAQASASVTEVGRAHGHAETVQALVEALPLSERLTHCHEQVAEAGLVAEEADLHDSVAVFRAWVATRSHRPVLRIEHLGA